LPTAELQVRLLPNELKRAAVKPPAQPTLVRTQHLPPPAETRFDLRIRRSSDRPPFRGSVVTVSTRIRVLLTVHGRQTDGRPSLSGPEGHGWRGTRSVRSLAADEARWPRRGRGTRTRACGSVHPTRHNTNPPVSVKGLRRRSYPLVTWNPGKLLVTERPVLFRTGARSPPWRDEGAPGGGRCGRRGRVTAYMALSPSIGLRAPLRS
jgi:hypothetical protein